MKNLVWLASYPKSGNTWLRILLHSILSEGGKLVNINEIKITSLGFIQRHALDEFMELDSTELTIPETYQAKRAYYVQLSGESERDVFIKTHDANIQLSDGQYLTPQEVTKLAIYLVRNPLDIVGSFANHLNLGFDNTINIMQDKHYTFFRNSKGVSSRVDQFLSDWNSHVKSWINTKGFPVIIVKYEDLISSPYQPLRAILSALNKTSVDDELIKAAIENNSFENLVKRERDQGFKEKGTYAPSFFRKGKAGSWKEELSQQQVARVCEAHEEMMLHFNYLPGH
jgi:hypothetical protein